MNPELNKKKYRERFVEAFIRQGVAMQIQLLRKREGWSQKKLGELTDKKANAITRLEDPSYGKFTVTTLLEMAKAFDVALSVRFVSFSELEKQAERLGAEQLLAARFFDEFPVAKEPLAKGQRVEFVPSSPTPFAFPAVTTFARVKSRTATPAVGTR